MRIKLKHHGRATLRLTSYNILRYFLSKLTGLDLPCFARQSRTSLSMLHFTTQTAKEERSLELSVLYSATSSYRLLPCTLKIIIMIQQQITIIVMIMIMESHEISFTSVLQIGYLYFIRG